MNESVEDYLETIQILLNRNGKVRSIDIAKEMRFSKPSISIAIKKLKAAGCILIDTNGFISLTSQGQKKANDVLERHVVLTKALEYLGVPSNIANEEACKIEHHISDITFQKLKEHIKKGNAN